MDAVLDDVDAVVLSDYGKGALSEARTIIERCRAAGLPVLVDPKGPDFERYRGATMVTPNIAEFEAVVGHCPDESAFVERGQRLRRDLQLSLIHISEPTRPTT